MVCARQFIELEHFAKILVICVGFSSVTPDDDSQPVNTTSEYTRLRVVLHCVLTCSADENSESDYKR
jgi:hypothetical protein